MDGVINGHSIHTGHTINVDVSQDSNCGKILPSAPDHRPESKTLSSYIISGLERSAVAVARKLLSLVLYLRMMFAGKDVQGMQPLTSDQKAKANRILDQIENELINSLNKQSIDSVRNNIDKTFMTLGLLDENKQCVIRSFDGYYQGFSSEFDAEDLNQFVHLVIENIKKNDCLSHAVLAMSEADETFQALFKNAIEVALPHMVALDIITAVQIRNVDFLKECMSLWQNKARELGGNRKVFGLLATIKLISVERPIKTVVNCKTEKKELPENFGRCVLPINIVEAAALELVQGHYNNAYAGSIMVNTHPGKYCPATAAIDSSDEVLIYHPEAKEYNDLYASWNMRFCANFDLFPDLLSKLLIPTVSGYQNQPDRYIARRAYALYTTVNYIGFNKELKTSTALTSKMKKAWGKVNRCYADLYQRKVSELNRRTVGSQSLQMA